MNGQSFKIEQSFRSHGFEISHEPPAYKVLNSLTMPKRIALEIFSSLPYCPIVAENRPNGFLYFTVVPYQKPDHFEKKDCQKTEMGDEHFWQEVEKTKDLKTGHLLQVIFGGDFAAAEKQMISSCNLMSSLALEYCDEAPNRGTVLDLGCGQGVNSIPLLKKGWHVVAIDRSSHALEIYRQFVSLEEQSRLELIQADITEYPLKEKRFDLVLGVDVLSYVPSKELKSLMQKVHRSLVERGLLIGTLFYRESSKESSEESPMELFLREFGAHIYPGEQMSWNLLQKSGFHVEENSRREQEGSIGCAQFIARKESLL
ncbi:MAG: hypothetical protein K0S07_528 [Chlamydiales bacterium]|jgi:SAM-dependent methyltransferase|nr:hypothetical protein [Chlamydiales bacterium]